MNPMNKSSVLDQLAHEYAVNKYQSTSGLNGNGFLSDYLLSKKIISTDVVHSITGLMLQHRNKLIALFGKILIARLLKKQRFKIHTLLAIEALEGKSTSELLFNNCPIDMTDDFRVNYYLKFLASSPNKRQQILNDLDCEVSMLDDIFRNQTKYFTVERTQKINTIFGVDYETIIPSLKLDYRFDETCQNLLRHQSPVDLLNFEDNSGIRLTETSVNQRMLEIIKASGVTKNRFKTLTGVPQQTIIKLDDPNYELPLNQAIKVSKILPMYTSYLLLGCPSAQKISDTHLAGRELKQGNILNHVRQLKDQEGQVRLDANGSNSSLKRISEYFPERKRVHLRIKEMSNVLGLNGSYLAKKLDCSKQRISLLKSGSQLNYANIDLLAKALGLTTVELLYNTRSVKKSSSLIVNISVAFDINNIQLTQLPSSRTKSKYNMQRILKNYSHRFSLSEIEHAANLCNVSVLSLIPNTFSNFNVKQDSIDSRYATTIGSRLSLLLTDIAADSFIRWSSISWLSLKKIIDNERVYLHELELICEYFKVPLQWLIYGTCNEESGYIYDPDEYRTRLAKNKGKLSYEASKKIARKYSRQIKAKSLRDIEMIQIAELPDNYIVAPHLAFPEQFEGYSEFYGIE